MDLKGCGSDSKGVTITLEEGVRESEVMPLLTVSLQSMKMGGGNREKVEGKDRPLPCGTNLGNLNSFSILTYTLLKSPQSIGSKWDDVPLDSG